ncbi:hypothetical protein [Herpetosiphon sp. NSE202]|uniref:hypothetical protein n=1 Tax=Herpetosiphon sp. NSE202 TaxID=3351349 RepID=UPI00363454AA
MSRRSPKPSPWPRRFMYITGIVMVIFFAVALNGLYSGNFALAFPMFAGLTGLMLFMIILLFLHNRMNR